MAGEKREGFSARHLGFIELATTLKALSNSLSVSLIVIVVWSF